LLAPVCNLYFDEVSGKSARHKKHIAIDFPDAVVIGEGDIMNMD
jgi:hypothetical protein